MQSFIRPIVRPALAAACHATRVPALALPLRHLSLSARRLGDGRSDAALLDKLSGELKYEKDNSKALADLNDAVAAFKSEGVWQVDDTPGQDEVALTRSFGNEEIRILFSIADLDASDPELEAEELSGEESQVADSEVETALPVRTAITISKTGAGALTIDSTAQDGLFTIDSVAFYPDEKTGLDMSVEGDWQRRGLYMGPEFDALDEGLQEEFEGFLEERGINSSLALIIPDLAEQKEQKEYVRWLEGVKAFVEK